MAAGPSAPRLPREAVERRLFVDAPPAAVWRALHAPAPRVRGAVELAAPGPDWPAAGARRAARLRLGPVALPATVESLEARPDRRFRVGIVGSGVIGERRWELVPAAGGTRVATSIHLEGRGRLGRALLRLERGGLAGSLEAELTALKLSAEADADRGS